MINRAAAEYTIPWCASHDTGVICYSPMESGLLTESFTAARVASLAADDWRRRSREFREPRLPRNLALRDALRPVAGAVRDDGVLGRNCVVLSRPGVSGAIVGARTPKQVDGWIGAASLKLTARDLDEIATVIRSTGAGIGRRTRPRPLNKRPFTHKENR